MFTYDARIYMRSSFVTNHNHTAFLQPICKSGIENAVLDSDRAHWDYIKKNSMYIPKQKENFSFWWFPRTVQMVSRPP